MSIQDGVPTGASRWRPSPVELDDIELALLGVWSRCRADGPARTVSIVVPSSLASEARSDGALVLVEEEGAPYAVLDVTHAAGVDGERSELIGQVTALAEVARGSHRSLRRPPPVDGDDSRPVLAVPVDRPLPSAMVVQLSVAAERLGARLRLLPLTGNGRPRGLDGSALVRSCLAVRSVSAADVIPVAVADHGDQSRDAARAVHVAAAYGAAYVAGPLAEQAESGDGCCGTPELIDLPDVALDDRTGQWAAADDVPPEFRSARTLAEVTHDLAAFVDLRSPIDLELFDLATRRELRRSRPLGRVGFAVLFTGLSGSGKSTIARALQERILERTDRTVTLLDGDVVRQMLSSELTFSREHRVLNVRRIGFVASEVAAHGGIVLCAPIAPYESSRREVRAMVEQTGAGFLLVHVATPLEICESRDRKGLYARARAGTIPEFTGVSDPYECPQSPDLTVDTTIDDLDGAVDRILAVGAERGWVELNDVGAPSTGDDHRLPTGG